MVNNTTIQPSDNPLRIRKTYFKMKVREEIKIIKNKVKSNKAQYNLDRETTKISALSSGNISKYEFLTNDGNSLE